MRGGLTCEVVSYKGGGVSMIWKDFRKTTPYTWHNLCLQDRLYCMFSAYRLHFNASVKACTISRAKPSFISLTLNVSSTALMPMAFILVYSLFFLLFFTDRPRFDAFWNSQEIHSLVIIACKDSEIYKHSYGLMQDSDNSSDLISNEDTKVLHYIIHIQCGAVIIWSVFMKIHTIGTP